MVSSIIYGTDEDLIFDEEGSKPTPLSIETRKSCVI